MKLIDRAILYISDLALMILSIALIVIPFGVVSDEDLERIADNINGNYYIAVVGVVIFLITVKPILFSGGKKRIKEIISPMQGGDLRISDEAVRGIAESAVSRFNGIRDQKVDVKFNEAGIVLTVNGAATPDVNIPTMTEEIQKSVIETVENSTGMNVEKVNMEITRFSAGTPRAVR